MSKLQDIAKRESSIKRTENGAMVYNTTYNACIDLFALGGALRPRSEEDIRDKFANAFNESPEITTKMLFYIGNIRGGLGERRTFNVCLKWLAENYPSIVIKNLENIPHFNRWDSLFTLVGTACEQDMWKYIDMQLTKDIESYYAMRPVSLLAKWMPSENATSKETKALAHRGMSALEFTPRNYRKTLSKLRKYIDVTEVKMSSNKWTDINYEVVPSRAMANYNCAFKRHDAEGFGKYIEALNKGEKKINASTLFPYDLVKNYIYWNNSQKSEVVEQQWKALPNYVEGDSNILVMADVSGSMYGRPLETSVGLAIYFAERNDGPLKGTYMTFTDRPHFQYITGLETLRAKVNKVTRTDIGYSTNLEAAFDYLLKQAVENGFTQKDMPEAICVISDMEVDKYMRPGYKWDFIQTQKVKYERCGYKLPKMILWNVEARQDTFLSQSDDVLFVSGQSPSVFKQLMGNLNGVTSYDLMMKTLNDEMYDCVVV